jgi:hypothetical protein
MISKIKLKSGVKLTQNKEEIKEIVEKLGHPERILAQK